jgi:hypothetical protein
MKQTLCALAAAMACSWAQATAPAALAHSPGCAVAPAGDAAGVLYSQNGQDSGVSIVSQAFESCFDLYDVQAADDFVVPAGQAWEVSEVDVTGAYFNGSGPADSVNLYFYKDTKGLPGALVAAFYALHGDFGSGSFAVQPQGKAKLKGHLWASVQVLMTFSAGGEWGWESQTAIVNRPAVWQNPGGGFNTGCTTWTPERRCFVGAAGDQMFTIKGKVH